MILSLSEGEGVGKIKEGYKNKGGSAKLKALKADLGELLHQPILARGISAKFITSGSRPIVDDLLRGDSMSHYIGLVVQILRTTFSSRHFARRKNY
jgi:ATP-dependent RNA helicase DDX24/MAK5